MEFGCTKKLLDYLGIKPAKPTAEVDPFFSWTANLITLNRRKVIVAVNTATQYIFIIHGITAKSIPQLPDLILGGIRSMLESEYISSDIIEKYLDDCGRNISFVSTSSRSAGTYCNNACARCERFMYLFEAGDAFQQKYLPWINDDLIPKDNYIFKREKLLETLKEKYEGPIQSAHVSVLEVSLDLLTPCRRTIVVPSNINFYQLHKILQNAFEWHDSHLHHFISKIDNEGRAQEIIQPPDKDDNNLYMPSGIKFTSSLDITVREVFESRQKILYEYDFGDSWMHSIELKEFIENCHEPYPHCIDAIGDAPMEDSGGIYGFDEKIKILNDPHHAEYEAISCWVRRTTWNSVNIDHINGRMLDAHRYCVPVCY